MWRCSAVSDGIRLNASQARIRCTATRNVALLGEKQAQVPKGRSRKRKEERGHRRGGRYGPLGNEEGCSSWRDGFLRETPACSEFETDGHAVHLLRHCTMQVHTKRQKKMWTKVYFVQENELSCEGSRTSPTCGAKAKKEGGGCGRGKRKRKRERGSSSGTHPLVIEGKASGAKRQSNRSFVFANEKRAEALSPNGPIRRERKRREHSKTPSGEGVDCLCGAVRTHPERIKNSLGLLQLNGKLNGLAQPLCNERVSLRCLPAAFEPG